MYPRKGKNKAINGRKGVQRYSKKADRSGLAMIRYGMRVNADTGSKAGRKRQAVAEAQDRARGMA